MQCTGLYRKISHRGNPSAKKDVYCNTNDCIARQSTEERRPRAEIHQIMLQDTAVAQEGKIVYRKTNLSLAIQSHTKQLKAVSCNTVSRPTRRYNLAIQFIHIAIQNVHKTTLSPAELILQYNLKVKGVIQSWNTIKPVCDTTTHKTIRNPECLIWQYSSQGRHDANSRYNDAVLKYILKGLTWTLSIRRSQYVAAATIHDFVCMDPGNQQHRF